MPFVYEVTIRKTLKYILKFIKPIKTLYSPFGESLILVISIIVEHDLLVLCVS